MQSRFALELDPARTADIMFAIAPRSVWTIASADDAEFLARIAVGLRADDPPTQEMRGIADRIWERASANTEVRP